MTLPRTIRVRNSQTKETWGEVGEEGEAHSEDLDEELESEAESEVESHEDESSVIANDDPYVSHFGSSQESGPSILTSASRSAIDTRKLIAQRLTLGTGPDELGAVVLSHPEGVELGQTPKTNNGNNARLLAHSKAAAAATEAAKSGSSKVSLPDPPSDVRDQGFTRPTVLILLPFRNSALAFVNTLISALETYHNKLRPIPKRVWSASRREDKLLSAEPGTYPSDHVRNFAGNTDDAFRLGIRLSNKGKGWRLFSDSLTQTLSLRAH
ncbi:U3 small nucleolar RNA-associated protein 25 [Rhizoctonia solani]|uniref:U3 small nucleolar RNA-associated protein 25 n=1 Tax=Rhizoctonia solani TaxID=456999 RepID=A0A8H8SZW5_9AGAM|nr:U3 small nucleolar RNA-associated protein 25 [Rhizoctonia solani]QRW24044.1 U3 small nucleolar RNA-associated protein 25 [Rhizoctonia solani]